MFHINFIVHLFIKIAMKISREHRTRAAFFYQKITGIDQNRRCYVSPQRVRDYKLQPSYTVYWKFKWYYTFYINFDLFSQNVKFSSLSFFRKILKFYSLSCFGPKKGGAIAPVAPPMATPMLCQVLQSYKILLALYFVIMCVLYMPATRVH